MKRHTIGTLLLATALGVPALVGCDETTSDRKVETQKSDGTVVKEQEKTVQKADGTVEKTEKKTVDRDDAGGNDDKTVVREKTEPDGDKKIEVEKKD